MFLKSILARVAIVSLVSISSFIAFSTSARAADGSSGCGPGWYLLQKNSLLSSALRTTTNTVLFPISLLGMTFGTSNCSKHFLVKNESRALHYVTHSHFDLRTDIARGSGPYLVTLNATLGCKPTSSPRLAKLLKSQSTQAYVSAPEDLLKNVYTLILTDRELAHECGASGTNQV
jgi:hypothetical protein